MNDPMNAATRFPDIYFLPQWGKLFEEHDHGKSGIFEYRGEKGHVYYQFMKRVLPAELECPDHVDLVTPYGFSGPVIIDCPSGDRQGLVREFDRAFQEYCQRERIVSEYVRFSPWLKNHADFASVYETKYNNYTFFTDLQCGDFFAREFSSKRRNQVRKAQKHGVRCEFDFSGKSLPEFIRIYEFTIKKNKVAPYYQFAPNFLHRTFSALKERQFLINAKYNDRTISSSIFLIHDDLLHYHLCANDPEYYPLCANSLLLFEAAKWGQAQGKKQMHLGGAFTPELFAFKRQFTKKGICDFFVGKKTRNRQKSDELLERRKKKGGITDPDYFPLYRG
jgi:hypothetical protein